MKSAAGRKLMVTTAAGVLGALLVVAPATAQGQDDQGLGSRQTGDGVQAGSDMQVGSEVGAGSRGSTATRTGKRANTRANHANAKVRARGDVRTRSRRVYTGRTVVSTDVEGSRRYETWGPADMLRDTRWRDRGYYRYGGDPSFGMGFGYSNPYHSYGYSTPSYAYRYSDPYYSYGYARPYRYDGPAPYGSWGTSSWDRGGRWYAFDPCGSVKHVRGGARLHLSLKLSGGPRDLNATTA